MLERDVLFDRIVGVYCQRETLKQPTGAETTAGDNPTALTGLKAASPRFYYAPTALLSDFR